MLCVWNSKCQCKTGPVWVRFMWWTDDKVTKETRVFMRVPLASRIHDRLTRLGHDNVSMSYNHF